ncbi:unnamed protein product [Diatraea saccharalis]|uniref:Phosphatidic acid phosphatase type 2/haloperoxidase domain-containing protein n=1 Tax=Diatraea saccharalis TaxID=40085 RepID=A0A9N9QPI2_9NEOP|nr:unnamed protein product [Diatraea saccharalis]
MWIELERIRARTPNLLTEIILRVTLIFFVCVLQIKVKPHVHHITESELTNYMRPRRDSYVPPWAMVIIIVLVPLMILSLSYILTGKYEDTVQSLLAWTLALTINAFITEVTKLIVGRPRPDYFYRCFPTGIKSFRNPNIKDVMEGRKSFPSGHSSFAFCSMGYLSIWLCGRLRVLSWNRGDVIRITACLIPLVLASLVAISRICDHHHHWEDITVGSVLGFVSSYFCYRQYYHPLDSTLSGYPYLATSRESLVPLNLQESSDDDDQYPFDSSFTKFHIIDDKKYT